MRCSIAIATSLLLFGSIQASASTWYVAGNGTDSANGLSTATPFRTLQKALNQTRPGDTVLAMNGTYVTACAACDVLDINRSGTAAARITVMAYPGMHPVINSTNAWNGINIMASYITVQGFEVAGGQKQVSQAYAMSNAGNTGNYLTAGGGIEVSSSSSNILTHIIISRNYVHDMPGAGISVTRADYITIANNVTLNNAYWSPYANSGINIYESRDSDSYTGIKNFVVGNRSQNNREYVPFFAVGHITDGNGIIIDDNTSSQYDHRAYNGRTLVADNIVSNNGGSGIHAFYSQHVDIMFNTAWMNNQTSTIDDGQIFAEAGADINIVNNIMGAPSGDVFYTTYNNASSVFQGYNLLYSATPTTALAAAPLGTHDVIADPRFVNASAGDFMLTASSPAVDSATPMFTMPNDYNGAPRSRGAGYDRGAFEFQGN